MHLVQSIAMADNNDVFWMLAAEDKLDGTNYPLWAYMMRHVLVAKGLWNIVQGVDIRPIVVGNPANPYISMNGLYPVDTCFVLL